MSNGELREVLEREFRRYGEHQVKVVNGSDEEERLAYVNFDVPGSAKRCRKSMQTRLADVFTSTSVLSPPLCRRLSSYSDVSLSSLCSLLPLNHSDPD